MTATKTAKVTAAGAAERRSRIRALMAAGEWSRGRTGRELAQEWGTTPMAVRHMAAEVSRELGWAPGREEREAVTADLDEATDLIRAGLEEGDDKRAQLHVKAGAALATIARQRAEVLGLRGQTTAEPKQGAEEVPFGWAKTEDDKPKGLSS